jgi:CRP-like cAMP-binding protein
MGTAGLYSRPQAGRAKVARKTRTADCRNCTILRSLQAASLPAKTVTAICERMWLTPLRRRQILYTEGNKATHLYAVRSGKVKLIRVESNGREYVSAVLESGDLFGFEAVFGEAYQTGAEAVMVGEVCQASGTELRTLMDRVPGVATDLARYLHRQLARARQRHEYLSAPNARARLAGFLLQSLETEAPGGDTVVARDLTLRDLGAILGLAPETVCRARRDLEARRVVQTLRSGIRVSDVHSLEQVAMS